MIDKLTIGKRISKYRDKSGLTQARLAELLGITAKHLSNIERGKVRLNTDLLSEIADKLNVDVVALLADADPAMPSYGMSELQEITKNWNPEQIGSLIQLAEIMDSQFKS